MVLLGGAGVAQANIITIGDGSNNLFDVNVVTGQVANQVTVSGTNSGEVLTDVAYVGADLYGITNANLYSIDRSTGNALLVGSGLGASATGAGINSMFYDGSTLFAMGFSGTNLFSIDFNSGSASIIGDVGTTTAGDIEQSNVAADELFISSLTPDNSTFTSVEKDGTGHSVIGNMGIGDVYGLAYVGNTLYGAAGTSVYSVNTVVGSTTLSAAIQDDIDVAYGATRVVPIPAAAWLFGSAMLGMLGIGRYAKTKAAA